MFKIAFCDDDERHLQHAKKLMDTYLASKPDLVVKTSFFNSSLDLLNYIDDYEPFDLYVLDIIMPDIDGIKLGLKLRDNQDMGLIIYLTTEQSFAVESYSTRAFHYLVKPVAYEQFQKTMDLAFHFLNTKTAKSITVKTSDGIIRLTFDQIVYVELMKRHLYFYLEDHRVKESVTIRMTFPEAISPLLIDNRFVLCGASYALNLHQITSIENDIVYFKNGSSLTPPKKALAAIRSQWLDYWLEGGISL